MIWIELVTLLAVLQFFALGILVSRARGTYHVKAPATTGNEMFERYYRVQMNTLELLIIFLPALWLSAQHWAPYFGAAAGVVYLVGRLVYLRAYVHDPSSRSLGFSLSVVPILLLLLADLAGMIRSLMAG